MRPGRRRPPVTCSGGSWRRWPWPAGRRGRRRRGRRWSSSSRCWRSADSLWIHIGVAESGLSLLTPTRGGADGRRRRRRRAMPTVGDGAAARPAGVPCARRHPVGPVAPGAPWMPWAPVAPGAPCGSGGPGRPGRSLRAGRLPSPPARPSAPVPPSPRWRPVGPVGPARGGAFDPRAGRRVEGERVAVGGAVMTTSVSPSSVVAPPPVPPVTPWSWSARAAAARCRPWPCRSPTGILRRQRRGPQVHDRVVLVCRRGRAEDRPLHGQGVGLAGDDDGRDDAHHLGVGEHDGVDGAGRPLGVEDGGERRLDGGDRRGDLARQGAAPGGAGDASRAFGAGRPGRSRQASGACRARWALGAGGAGRPGGADGSGRPGRRPWRRGCLSVPAGRGRLGGRAATSGRCLTAAASRAGRRRPSSSSPSRCR